MSPECALQAFQFTNIYAHKLVADLPDEQLAELPHPGMNHPAWILGHLIVAAAFVPKLAGQPTGLDDDWMAQFGPGSVPHSDRGAYPSRDELLARLDAAYERAVEILPSFTPEQLSAPNPGPFLPVEFPTIGGLITHLLTTHQAAHLGQLSAWRRCVGRTGSVLGI